MSPCHITNTKTSNYSASTMRYSNKRREIPPLSEWIVHKTRNAGLPVQSFSSSARKKESSPNCLPFFFYLSSILSFNKQMSQLNQQRTPHLVVAVENHHHHITIIMLIVYLSMYNVRLNHKWNLYIKQCINIWMKSYLKIELKLVPILKQIFGSYQLNCVYLMIFKKKKKKKVYHLEHRHHHLPITSQTSLHFSL